jgi:hypothetical protein
MPTVFDVAFMKINILGKLLDFVRLGAPDNRKNGDTPNRGNPGEFHAVNLCSAPTFVNVEEGRFNLENSANTNHNLAARRIGPAAVR